MQNSLANTLLRITGPDEVRGRVMSIYSLTFQGFMRLGGLQAGLMADAIGASRSPGHGRGGLAGVWVVRGDQVPEGKGDAVSVMLGSGGAKVRRSTG
jgi:hypothetical protein